MRSSKRLFSIVLSLICLALAFTALSACKSGIEKYQPNISELRDKVFDVDANGMNVFIISGVKEDPYVLDGKSGEKVDFTVITVTPSEYDPLREYTYSITIGQNEYTGVLSKHPFGKSFSCNIATRITQDQLSLSIFDNGTESQITCESKITADMITAEKAFEVASQRLKEQIKTLSIGSKLNAEVYIRFMSNPIDNSGGYYWYVAFVGADDVTYAALINPFSLEVVAVRD